MPPRMALSTRAINVLSIRERQEKLIESYLNFYEHAKIELKVCSQKICSAVNEASEDDELVLLYVKIMRCTFVVLFLCNF